MKLINLIKLRKLHGLTQQQLADFLEISYVTYSNYENGKYPITSDKLIELANLFDTSIDYLLGRKRIIRTTTYENIGGEFKEVETVDDQIQARLKKKGI